MLKMRACLQCVRIPVISLFSSPSTMLVFSSSSYSGYRISHHTQPSSFDRSLCENNIVFITLDSILNVQSFFLECGFVKIAFISNVKMYEKHLGKL